MATPSPKPVQVTNDKEEIPLLDQVNTAVRLHDWIALINILKKCQSSEMIEIFQSKACVDSFLPDILRNGGYDIAFLLKEISKLDMTEFIKTDGKKCNILCHAVEGQRMDWVDYLLKIGADVNQHSESQQSPLTQACVGGNKDLVVKLVQKGACVDGSARSRYTPLMEAVLRGYVDIAQYLLEEHANPNLQNLDGQTALHCAVDSFPSNAVKLIPLLLQHKAELCADKNGNTPLSLVVQRGQVDILDLLLEMQRSKEDRTNSMELCAANRAPNDMATVFELLQRAMNERYEDLSNVLHKPDQVPDPDLGYASESRSPLELLERKDNTPALLMDCFNIRKRNASSEARRQTSHIGDQDIYKWLLGGGHHKEMCFIIGKDCEYFPHILRTVEATFSSMLARGQILLFADVMMYLNACRKHFNRRVQESNGVDYSWDSDDAYSVANTIVRCLFICNRLVDSEEDVQYLEEMTKDLSYCLQRVYHPVYKYSLLTAAVRYWEECTNDFTRTLLEKFIVFLIGCGVSMDCRDQDGDTPLHILAKSDDTAARSMAERLLRNGADLDLLDAQGRTPAQCAGT